MSFTAGIVRLIDRVPGPIAALAAGDSRPARLTRPLFNRIVPADETVVTIRSGAGKGLRLPVMPRSEKFYWTGAYERHVQDLLTGMLEPGMRFWDVGAHIGFFTLIAARLVADSGSVTAIEPMPDTRIRLNRAIALNGLTNVTVCDFAIADSADVRTLYPPRAPGGHPDGQQRSSMWTLAEDRGEDAGVSVECRRLDDVATTAAPPDVVKIDAEGAEVDVLKGGADLLETRHPALIVEMHDEQKLERARSLLRSYAFDHLGENHWLLT